MQLLIYFVGKLHLYNFFGHLATAAFIANSERLSLLDDFERALLLAIPRLYFLGYFDLVS